MQGKEIVAVSPHALLFFPVMILIVDTFNNTNSVFTLSDTVTIIYNMCVD